MNFLSSCIKGIVLGAGAILPGISSGVLLVIFGLYETFINRVLNFFKNPKENFCFFFPIVLGCLIGIILSGNLLIYFFKNYEIQTKYCFIGLILGSLPVLFKQANKKSGFRLHYILYLLFSLIFTLILIFIEQTLPFFTASNISFVFLCFSGFLMSIGVVVPGISSSAILMILGVYDMYLGAISTLNFTILLPMGIGLFLGGLLFLKLIYFLLEKSYAPTHYSIIGFVIGSALVLFPGFKFTTSHFISLILFILCFKIAYKMQKDS